jgi:hypothetical protein
MLGPLQKHDAPLGEEAVPSGAVFQKDNGSMYAGPVLKIRRGD